jgi:hypothetical protein
VKLDFLSEPFESPGVEISWGCGAILIEHSRSRVCGLIATDSR